MENGGQSCLFRGHAELFNGLYQRIVAAVAEGGPAFAPRAQRTLQIVCLDEVAANHGAQVLHEAAEAEEQVHIVGGHHAALSRGDAQIGDEVGQQLPQEEAIFVNDGNLDKLVAAGQAPLVGEAAVAVAVGANHLFVAREQYERQGEEGGMNMQRITLKDSCILTLSAVEDGAIALPVVALDVRRCQLALQKMVEFFFVKKVKHNVFALHRLRADLHPFHVDIR